MLLFSRPTLPSLIVLCVIEDLLQSLILRTWLLELSIKESVLKDCNQSTVLLNTNKWDSLCPNEVTQRLPMPETTKQPVES